MDGGDPLVATHDLRARVLATILAGLAIGAPFVAGLLILQGQMQGTTDRSMLVVVLSLVPFPVLWLIRRQLAPAVLRVSAISVLSLVTVMTAVFSGITPGSCLLMLMVILLAAVLWGARAALIALAGNVLLIGACATLILSATVRPADRHYWDPHQPIVWLRYAVVFVTTGGSLALAFTAMIRSLEQRAAALQEALLRERAEREARERSEAALERSQRLEAMGQLAGGIAHDFNNMLTVVLSMAEVIEKSQDRARIMEAATMIREAGESSSRLARRMLLLGRKEQVPIERVSVRESLRLFQRVLQHRLPSGVKLTVDDSFECAVMVPVSQLEQALLNLTLNATDAMAGQGTLEIQTRDRTIEQPPAGWRAHSGRFVEVSITDTGTGMSEQTLAHIFEPFFTTKQPGQGSGLGLAMVRTLVYDAGGFIEVDSQLGRGTTFHCYLPVTNPSP